MKDITLDEKFLDYIAGQKMAHLIADRKQEADYSTSDELDSLDKAEEDKPDRIKFLENRFRRRNNAAMLLANRIKSGYFDEASTEDLVKRRKRDYKSFHKTQDLHAEYELSFLGKSPDYCSYKPIAIENLIKLNEEIDIRERISDRLQGEEFE